MAALQHEVCGRERIIDAGRRLFSTQGFHQTSVAELAAAADVSVGQIYRLFTGKADVILAIVQEEVEDRLQATSALCDQVTSDAVSLEDGFTELAMRALSIRDEALSFEILAEAHRNPDVARAITSMCQRYRPLLRALVHHAAPSLGAIDLDGTEELLLAMTFGLGHRALSRPHLPVQETARQMSRMLIAALRGR